MPSVWSQILGSLKTTRTTFSPPYPAKTKVRTRYRSSRGSQSSHRSTWAGRLRPILGISSRRSRSSSKILRRRESQKSSNSTKTDQTLPLTRGPKNYWANKRFRTSSIRNTSSSSRINWWPRSTRWKRCMLKTRGILRFRRSRLSSTPKRILPIQVLSRWW